MTQWAVVVRPDYTQNVRLMGPYRSRAVAEAVGRRFDALDDGTREPALIPEVVRLEAWPRVFDDLTPDREDGGRDDG